MKGRAELGIYELASKVLPVVLDGADGDGSQDQYEINATLGPLVKA